MLVALLTILSFMHIVFFLAIWKKRNDFADVIWGPGFLIASLVVIVWQWQTRENFEFGLRPAIVVSCVAFWSIRLFFHIGIRNLSHDKEDSRYAKWRMEWGQNWISRSYLQIFILQGMVMWIMVWPIIKAITAAPVVLDPLFAVGLLLWVTGYFFEVVGDEQLRQFTRERQNKGKIMDQGLWRWSRHPNYFGEVTQWWGLFLMVVVLPGGWMTIVSPLVITYMILKVTGVPMLEKLMEGRSGWEEYKKRTSIFFPLPPKK